MLHGTYPNFYLTNARTRQDNKYLDQGYIKLPIPPSSPGGKFIESVGEEYQVVKRGREYHICGEGYNVRKGKVYPSTALALFYIRNLNPGSARTPSTCSRKRLNFNITHARTRQENIYPLLLSRSRT